MLKLRGISLDHTSKCRKAFFKQNQQTASIYKININKNAMCSKVAITMLAVTQGRGSYKIPSGLTCDPNNVLHIRRIQKTTNLKKNN